MCFQHAFSHKHSIDGAMYQKKKRMNERKKRSSSLGGANGITNVYLITQI